MFPDGAAMPFEAAIDTGFDGYLSVTPDEAARARMPFREVRTYELGSGQLVEFPVHDATVMWDSQEVEVPALVTDGGFLIGMAMLTGYVLHIDVIDGGEVRIERRI